MKVHSKTQPALGVSRMVPHFPPSPSYHLERCTQPFQLEGTHGRPGSQAAGTQGSSEFSFHSGLGTSRKLPLAWKQKEETCVCPLGWGTLGEKTVPGFGVAVRHRHPHLSPGAGEWWTPAQPPFGFLSLITQLSNQPVQPPPLGKENVISTLFLSLSFFFFFFCYFELTWGKVLQGVSLCSYLFFFVLCQFQLYTTVGEFNLDTMKADTRNINYFQDSELWELVRILSPFKTQCNFSTQ